jgi:hypothetical protein
MSTRAIKATSAGRSASRGIDFRPTISTFRVAAFAGRYDCRSPGCRGDTLPYLGQLAPMCQRHKCSERHSYPASKTVI